MIAKTKKKLFKASKKVKKELQAILFWRLSMLISRVEVIIRSGERCHSLRKPGMKAGSSV
jgi:hypothetical protein